MSLIPIRRLNENGIAEFERFLKRMSSDPADIDCSYLLQSNQFSDSLPFADVLVEKRSFQSRYEFARYLDERFETAGKTYDVDVPGMWEWLSAFYFDELRPRGRTTGTDLRRFIIESTAGRRSHRHLLRDPYTLYRRYRHSTNGELDILLCDPLWNHGDVVENLSARSRLRNSPGALQVARMLYFDSATGKTKVGTRSGSGGHRHFSRFLRNLPPQFDLSTISAETILTLLPAAFDKWYELGEDSQFLFDLGEPMFDPDPMHDEPVPGTLELADILQDADERSFSQSQRRVRSDLFRTGVLGAYENRCAISQVGLVHTEHDEDINYEVEASHVIPVARGGKDVLPNGIALSRSLHWAFDLGMVWVDREMRVQVANDVQSDRRNEWLRAFEGRRLWIPDDAKLRPSTEALQWHEQHVAVR